MKYPRFYSFRNFMDMCLKESKIDELIKSQDLIFFFKKGKNIYGGTEENRVMFARMKDKSDKSPPLSLDEKPTFSAINIKRLITRKLIMGIGDGKAYVDGREIYAAKDLRVGLFTSTEGF